MARGNNSSPFSYMDYITIATLGKPFGLKGQVHAFSLTSFPELRFKKNHKYFLSGPKNGEPIPVTLNFVSVKGDALILGFKEITDPDQAKLYHGFSLDMDKEEAPMPEGYVRFGELVGMKAIDDEGNELGTLVDVLENATTPSLKFKSFQHKTFYVPFIDAFVGDIDKESKTIRIHVVEGML